MRSSLYQRRHLHSTNYAIHTCVLFDSSTTAGVGVLHVLGPIVAHVDDFPLLWGLFAGLPLPHVLPGALLLVPGRLFSFPRAHGRLRVAAAVWSLLNDGYGPFHWGALPGLQLDLHDGLHLGKVKWLNRIINGNNLDIVRLRAFTSGTITGGQCV